MAKSKKRKPKGKDSKLVRSLRSIPIARPPGMKLYWVLALIPVFSSSLDLAGVTLLTRARSAIVYGAYETKPDKDLVPVLLPESALEKLGEIMGSEEAAVEDSSPAEVVPEEDVRGD